MATTYTELAATLRSLFVTNEADSDFATILPRCIEAAELRIYRELLPVALLTTAETTLTAGQPHFTLPADFISARAFTLYSPVGGTARAELPRRDSRFLAEYWPDSAAVGVPKYWAEVNFSTCLLAPTPAAGYALQLLYFSRPATLSASNPTTWLTAWVPDLLEYACMAWLAGYGKQYGAGDDPGAGGYWEAAYARAMQQAQLEEAQRRGLQDTPPGLKPST